MDNLEHYYLLNISKIYVHSPCSVRSRHHVPQEVGENYLYMVGMIAHAEQSADQ